MYPVFQWEVNIPLKKTIFIYQSTHWGLRVILKHKRISAKVSSSVKYFQFCKKLIAFHPDENWIDTHKLASLKKDSTKSVQQSTFSYTGTGAFVPAGEDIHKC